MLRPKAKHVLVSLRKRPNMLRLAAKHGTPECGVTIAFDARPGAPPPQSPQASPAPATRC
jgi:hypothetical protein